MSRKMTGTEKMNAYAIAEQAQDLLRHLEDLLDDTDIGEEASLHMSDDLDEIMGALLN